MNTTLASRIDRQFPPYISYGVMPNPNKKYQALGYRTLLVAVFPYYYPENRGLFSRYCSVYDYHIVVKEEFEKIFSPLGVSYLSMTDVSPFREKELAQELGLGQIGRHNLLLTKDYGSFVFIGEALLKEELPAKKEPAQTLCTGCDACRRACPTGCLEPTFQKERCLSYLSQKKELSREEERLFRKSKIVWGCDICQLACPVSQNAILTAIEKFKTPILTLDKDEINTLTDAQFREKYRDFAFSYKGIEILKRNVRLLDEEEV